MRLLDRLVGVDRRRYEESTIDLLKRKAVEQGLDPAFFDEIAKLPCCPGSLGPDDPGRIGGCKPCYSPEAER